jgi:hypothetical protein
MIVNTQHQVDPRWRCPTCQCWPLNLTDPEADNAPPVFVERHDEDWPELRRLTQDPTGPDVQTL